MLIYVKPGEYKYGPYTVRRNRGTAMFGDWAIYHGDSVVEGATSDPGRILSALSALVGEGDNAGSVIAQYMDYDPDRVVALAADLLEEINYHSDAARLRGDPDTGAGIMVLTGFEGKAKIQAMRAIRNHTPIQGLRERKRLVGDVEAGNHNSVGVHNVGEARKAFDAVGLQYRVEVSS